MGKQTAQAKKVYWSKDEMMDRVKDCSVDVMIENWRSCMRGIIMLYVPSQQNPVDAPSSNLSSLEYTLTSEIWNEVQLRFGSAKGYSCN